MKEEAKKVLKKLEEHGYEAYFVGGCVRDWLLHRPVHDIDICTNAHPGDIMKLFPDHIPTGLQHGTVTVKQDGYLFEVTTFRTEGVYEDFRRPSEVTYVNEVVEDLARRDFTINAMAMKYNKELIDPFFGLEDVNDHVIRAVGDASRRFQEDALRLVRGVRFASQLGFQIEDETRKAMRDNAPLLIHIAVERIREECNKLIDSRHPDKGFQFAKQTKIFQSIPLLQQLFDQSTMHLWRLQTVESVIHKWVVLLFAADFSWEQSRELCRYLKMSRKEEETITFLMQQLMLLQPLWDQCQSIDWTRLIMKHGLERCYDLEKVLDVLWWNDLSNKKNTLQATLDKMAVKTLKELAVDGSEIRKLSDQKQGPWIQKTLEYLWERTVTGELANVSEALLIAAKDFIHGEKEHPANEMKK
ncbi:CCA tRNA nucleotidyltransferase [Brevibacillus laterosporus]|uniref:CCA tRNA nucleotidyltransferase n=1 Tax=Brevibacillus laterosporus TaxID=1465 RepID=UPI0003B22FE9|nr:CCA tRNA nucleotidyltransferase [Brevibacillus laterosporus]ERM20120.1 tRNA nucleotidyltransferase/poly(A) polymerase [Brevibacillus laterosporus PE36]